MPPSDNVLQKETVQVSKQTWVNQRQNAYSDWSMPFWRELFQNSVDNGADRIDIRLGAADGRGAFGEAAAVDRVVRVSFADNGTGMDEDTLRKVFFSAGASSKRGVEGKTGGFGTARIMLCWSQVRYAIRTNGLFVEGDGSSFTCESSAQAIETRRAMLSALEASGEKDRAALVRADIASLEGGAADRKGAEFEIDIDPAEGTWNRVTEATLRQRLMSYLEMSQISAKVFLNGEEIKLETRRGPARRQLTADLGADGQAVPFGSVHLSESKKAKYKGKVIVRVNGAVMFTRDTEAQQQVIVELNPAMSRDVLTDSRDSMKGPFQESFSAFISTMAVDTQTALKEIEDRKYEVIRGSLGDMRLIREEAPETVSGDEETAVRLDSTTAADFIENAMANEQRQHDKAARGLKPLTPMQEAEIATTVRDALTSVLSDVRSGAPALLEGVPDSLRPEWEVFASNAQRDPSKALAAASPALAAHLLLEVRRREVGEGSPTGPVHVHDLHVLREDKFTGDKRMQYAMRVWKPTFWKVGDKAFGGGSAGHWNAPHQLFAVWTACVRYAVDILAKQHPSLTKDGDVRFATGWYFGRGREEWNYDAGKYELRRTGAKYRKLEDGTHVFLLNPVLDNGEPAFDLAADEDTLDENGVSGMGRLLALVKHEVAHAVADRHDERFASALTKLDSAFSQIRHMQGVHKAAKSAADAVAAAYGRGSSRMQAMDPDVFEGPIVSNEAPGSAAPAAKARSPRRVARPAERLMAHAAPMAMSIIGAMASPENENLPGAQEAMQALASASAQHPDGTRTVDCDQLASLELQVTSTIEAAKEAAAEIVAPPPAAVRAGTDGAAPREPETVEAPAAAPTATDWDADLGELDQAAAFATSGSFNELGSAGQAVHAVAPVPAPPSPEANWDDLDAELDNAASFATMGSLSDLAGTGQVEAPMLPPEQPAAPQAVAEPDPVPVPVQRAPASPPRPAPAAAPLIGAEMSLADFSFDLGPSDNSAVVPPTAAPAQVEVKQEAVATAPEPAPNAPMPQGVNLVNDPRLDDLLGADFSMDEVEAPAMRR